MHADAAAGKLRAVADQVVAVGDDPAGVGLDVLLVSRLRHRERVVHGVPPLLLLAPVEERKVHDEGEGQEVRIGETQASPHLVAQVAQGGVGGPRRSGDDEDHVADLGLGAVRDCTYLVQRQEARGRRPDHLLREGGERPLLAVEGYGHETLRPPSPDEIGELVHLAAGVGRAARRAESLDHAAGGDHRPEDAELRLRGYVRKVGHVELEPQVRLVRPVERHGLGIGHPREGSDHPLVGEQRLDHVGVELLDQAPGRRPPRQSSSLGRAGCAPAAGRRVGPRRESTGRSGSTSPTPDTIRSCLSC